MWLLPILDDQKLSGSPDIEVNGPVRAVDGGVHLDGKESYLKVGNFDGKCLHDPAKCPNGLSLSCKLKFNRVSILFSIRLVRSDHPWCKCSPMGKSRKISSNVID